MIERRVVGDLDISLPTGIPLRLVLLESWGVKVGCRIDKNVFDAAHWLGTGLITLSSVVRIDQPQPINTPKWGADNLNDSQAYQQFYGHRKWYNKLWLSERMGYAAGPAGMRPPVPGRYICRPICNLNGMGLGATFMYVSTGDELPPGHFWSESFNGVHRTIDFENNDGVWNQSRCSIGIKSTTNSFVFDRWVRDNDFDFDLPQFFDDILIHQYSYKIPVINIELIDDKIIEVHLRGSPDPDKDIVIPIFDREKISEWKRMGLNWVPDPEDAGGWLHTPRLGFMVSRS